MTTLLLHLPIVTILLLHCLSPVDADDSCKDCVSRGCAYCQGNEFFQQHGSPHQTYESVCVCQGLRDGFFGGCDDHSFGAEELTSKSDCTVGNKAGEGILAGIILGCIFFCGVVTVVVMLLTKQTNQRAKHSPTINNINTSNQHHENQEDVHSQSDVLDDVEMFTSPSGRPDLGDSDADLEVFITASGRRELPEDVPSPTKKATAIPIGDAVPVNEQSLRCKNAVEVTATPVP